MHVQELEDDGTEIKPYRLWRALVVDLFDHPVVGWDRKPPPPKNKAKHAQPYMLAWEWMFSYAASYDHKRIIQEQPILLRRGQIVCSQRFLSERFNWGRKSVRMFLEKLERFGMITIQSVVEADQLALAFPGLTTGVPKSGQPLHIITICNFGKYQPDLRKVGQGRAHLGPRSGPPRAQRTTSNTYNKDDRGPEPSCADEDPDHNVVELEQHRPQPANAHGLSEGQFVRYHALAVEWVHKPGAITFGTIERSFTDDSLRSLVAIHAQHEDHVLSRAVDLTLANVKAKVYDQTQIAEQKSRSGLASFANYFSKCLASSVREVALGDKNLQSRALADMKLQEESYKTRMSRVRNGGRGSSWEDLGNEVFGGME